MKKGRIVSLFLVLVLTVAFLVMPVGAAPDVQDVSLNPVPSATSSGSNKEAGEWDDLLEELKYELNDDMFEIVNFYENEQGGFTLVFRIINMDLYDDEPLYKEDAADVQNLYEFVDSQLLMYFDDVADDDAITSRVVLYLSQIKTDFYPGAYLSSYLEHTEAEAIHNRIDSKYKNTTDVLYLNQQAPLNTVSKIVVMNNYDFTESNTVIYRYNVKDGTITKLDTTVTKDSKGFLHFKADPYGVLIISQGELVAK